jgi:ABC-type sugar transport system permease subunit
VVAVVIWKFLLDPNIGSLHHAIAALGLPEVNWAADPTAGLVLVCIISIWLHLPFTFIILYAAMLAVPRELYESARIDGANGWQNFRYITVPSVLPAVFVALIFRYILAFRLFSEVWLLTGGGPARMTEVMAIYLYKQSFTYASFGKGAATGWIMVMVSGLVAALYLYLLYRRGFRKDA